MSKESVKNKYKLLAVIFGLWLAVVIGTIMMVRTTMATLETIEELGNGVEELRSELYFDSPFRIQHADDISLKIQLIYSLRLQLEANDKGSWFQPDINQLLFTTDRFLDLVRQFVDTEVEVVNLVNSLQQVRENYTDQPEVSALYYQLSARVFEAMFSDSANSPKVYRSLDQLFITSQQLPNEDRERLQQLLAQTSSVLGGYAKGSYLVEKLLSHSLNYQVYQMEEAYHHSISRSGLFLVTLSGFTLLLVAFIAVRTEDSEAEQIVMQAELATVSEVKEPVKVTVEQPAPEVVKPVEVLQPEPKPEPKPVEANLATVDIDHMLNSLNGDTESVKLLLEVFIQDHQDDANQLPDLLDSDKTLAMRKAHSLKGVAGNLGAMTLRDIATQIEADIKNDVDVAPEKLQQLKENLASAVESAQVYLKSKT
ncbi:Hpt domain-containing protein [Vibrio sp. SCSIO 43135]|uniref:Hpt domain-containing protein n=1 Tax=Vibrio sp. SCSIO 43135 TaxID=2819096 RepID=UPI002075A7F7|nr:Hpt domain-containing protein [Vibrio sp. SCSIO 43135]USD41956.1 Hpt domain-containing protein [Vibrio sp. SCSIO 43135]